VGVIAGPDDRVWLDRLFFFFFLIPFFSHYSRMKGMRSTRDKVPRVEWGNSLSPRPAFPLHAKAEG